jgi:hypothetical protein
MSYEYKRNLPAAADCGKFDALASNARVVEWQTRTFEGRMPKGMRVQVPPRAPNRQSIYSFASQLFDVAFIAYRFRSLS